MKSHWSFPITCYAHRGGGNLFPENTLQAIEFGRKQGYRGVEFDVMLSKDNIPFLMHDDVLNRTVRNTQFIGYSFGDVLSQDIGIIDAGSWFNANFSDIKIPLFEDVLKYCITHKVLMNIEIKPVPDYDTITGQVVASTTAKYFPVETARENLPLFSSFSYESLVVAQSIAPHIPRGFLVDDLSTVPDWRERLQRIDAVSIHTNYEKLTTSQIDEIKSEGYKLLCYTVNEVEAAHQLLKSGVDAFCTDKLDLFQQFQ